jgi:hypothetical protein
LTFIKVFCEELDNHGGITKRKGTESMTTNLTTKPGNMTDIIEMFIKDAIDAYPAQSCYFTGRGL